MAYAQINYPQKQGINGVYSIHDIGCFLTSFCNLLTLRFGITIDPPTLNNYFVAHGTYIDVDDKISDDLFWQAITSYASQIVATRIGTAGLPTTNKAIVKFSYVTNGKHMTHFCLYDGDGYIIDSWDGQRKSIASAGRGNPVAFAEYGSPIPQQVTSQGADEMITNNDQAHQAYAMLRPNSPPSDAEIAATAGKRSWAQFMNDGNAEREQRDARLRAQAAQVAQLETAVQELHVQVSQSQTQLEQANAKVAELTSQLAAVPAPAPPAEATPEATSAVTTDIAKDSDWLVKVLQILFKKKA